MISTLLLKYENDEKNWTRHHRHPSDFRSHRKIGIKHHAKWNTLTPTITHWIVTIQCMTSRHCVTFIFHPIKSHSQHHLHDLSHLFELCIIQSYFLLDRQGWPISLTDISQWLFGLQRVDAMRMYLYFQTHVPCHINICCWPMYQVRLDIDWTMISIHLRLLKPLVSRHVRSDNATVVPVQPKQGQFYRTIILRIHSV